MIVIRQQVVQSDGDQPRRRVFLVHGRNLAAKSSVVNLLQAFDLRVIGWDEAAASTGQATPYTGDVVLAGMQMADAVVVLFSPDDIGHVKSEFLLPNDGEHERNPTPQARMNVIFEAGMAMALNRDATVLVELGDVRPMTDTAGLNVVRITSGSIAERIRFANRLRTAGLAVDLNSPDWATAGDFSVIATTAE